MSSTWKLTPVVLLCTAFAGAQAAWEAMPSGAVGSLLGVWGASGGNVFAVGREGTILHYKGVLRAIRMMS